MSATDLQTRGRQAYQRGQFDKALESFDRALLRQQTVQLYDHRAATYEKLRDFKNALQDAKSAIRTGDADPAGYLRAGRILVKMDKSQAALDIYAYGLRHIKHVGRGFEQLKKCHDELVAELAPTHSVDPLTVLPRELATSILEYCTFRERIVICRVSKGWRKFIRSEPNLWAHLDLSEAVRKRVTSSFISVAINTAQTKLTAATLSQLFYFDKALTALLRYCPLETLTLAQTGLQGQNFVDILQRSKDKLKLKELRILQGTEVSQLTLRDASLACQSTLEVLHCSYVERISFTNKWNSLALPKLKHLNITAKQIANLTLGLNPFLAGSPDLTSLTLVNLDEYLHEDNVHETLLNLKETKLEHIHLRLYLAGAHAIQLPASVRSLHLTPTGAHPSFFRDPPLLIDLQLQDLPHLEDVHLNLPRTPFDRILAEFQSELPTDYATHDSPPLSRLRSLNIERATIAKMPMLDMPPRLRELRALALRDVLELHDDRILHMVKQLPNLKSLDVSGSQITGAGVGDLLRLGQLTKMTLNDCHKIGHRDAIDRARQKGVKVEYAFADGSGGGKKLRYQQ